MTVKECKEMFKQTTSFTTAKKYVKDLNKLYKELENCEDYNEWMCELKTEIRPITAYTDGINYYIIDN